MLEIRKFAWVFLYTQFQKATAVHLLSYLSSQVLWGQFGRCKYFYPALVNLFITWLHPTLLVDLLLNMGFLLCGRGGWFELQHYPVSDWSVLRGAFPREWFFYVCRFWFFIFLRRGEAQEVEREERGGGQAPPPLALAQPLAIAPQAAEGVLPSVTLLELNSSFPVI